jgi:hypothetical protein
MPRSADAFADSAGVNVHLSYSATVYGTNAPLILARLTALGIRHIRDGTALGQTNVCSMLQQLAANGIRLDMIVSDTLTAANFAAYAACISPALESVEGPNEYDLSGRANWATTLDTMQPQLYAEAKSQGTIAVLGPALTSEGAYAAVGSLGASAEFGNMHDYFAGHNPGAAGWGSADAFGVYGSLAWNMGVAAQDVVAKPLVATESGYSTAADQYAVPAATQARYLMRTLLEHWNAGVVRTYVYELADEGSAPFSHYGLLDSGGNPKPAFNALHNLMAHVADPGGAPVLAPFPYALAAPASVHHALLQRRDGSYVLVLWNEVAEWNPDTSSTIATAAQPVTLTFGNVPGAVAVTSFDDNGVVTSAARAPASSLALSISGSPTLVDITR